MSAVLWKSLSSQCRVGFSRMPKRMSRGMISSSSLPGDAPSHLALLPIPLDATVAMSLFLLCLPKIRPIGRRLFFSTLTLPKAGTPGNRKEILHFSRSVP
ncbi:Uncharacterised protein [Mycobacterium tuberculosis]|nr:Uncharacterised protein [Mycobacterium tuberculosis]